MKQDAIDPVAADVLARIWSAVPKWHWRIVSRRQARILACAYNDIVSENKALHGIVADAVPVGEQKFKEALRNLRYASHAHTNHFDATGQGGVGCPACIAIRKSEAELDEILRLYRQRGER